MHISQENVEGNNKIILILNNTIFIWEKKISVSAMHVSQENYEGNIF